MKSRGDEMKKSVIITIIVIYVLAIVVVGFIGLKMKVYDEQKYVEKIECISDGYKDYDPNTETGLAKIHAGYIGYIKKDYKSGLKVEIKCRITPDNATHKKLEYIYDENSTIYKLTTNSDGTATIEFLTGGVATIIIRSTDSKQTQIKIEVSAFDWSILG